MKDGIIKGTGNSRYLKSVSNFLSLYPTYEAFAASLIAGTLPIDLNGINTNGWTQTGTSLNKASLLTDTLCTALGLATTATPTQAMSKLRTLITTAQSAAEAAQSAAEAAQSTADGRAQIAVGSYTGSGSSGSSNPNSLTFSFVPKVLMIPLFSYPKNLTHYEYNLWACITSNLTTSYVKGNGLGMHQDGYNLVYGKKSSNGKTIYWYNTGTSANQFNSSGYTYHYIAIG